jgi:hypothetical protein
MRETQICLQLACSRPTAVSAPRIGTRHFKVRECNSRGPLMTVNSEICQVSIAKTQAMEHNAAPRCGLHLFV